MNNEELCLYCGAPVPLKGYKTCGEKACLRQRNTELMRNYMLTNRALVNEQRRRRYHQHEKTQLSLPQGRAIRALWHEGHLIQEGCIIYSPTTQQRVCQLSVIESLSKKDFAIFIDGRWIPRITEDNFFANGYTIRETPKRKYIRTLNVAQAALLRSLYALPCVMIVNGSVATTDDQGHVTHIGQTRTAMNLALAGIIQIAADGQITILMDEPTVASNFKGY